MRRVTLAYIAIAVLVHADAASCQEKDEQVDLDHWVPSFGFTAGFIYQGADGVVQSNVRPFGSAGQEVDGAGTLVDPPVVFSGEIMTPGFSSVPGSPRLFLHGDLGSIFGSEVILASEGSPGAFEPPPPPAVTFPGAAVAGQGSQTTAENKSLIAGGGLGIAFTTSIRGRVLRVKPSFEYMRHEIEVKGTVRHVGGQIVFTPPPDPVLVNTLEFIALQSQTQRSLNSIGGGLELEMDTLRAGPFMISLLLNGQIYSLLDDDEIPMFASDGTNTAFWEVKLNSSVYRAGAGMRFRFLPEE